MARKDEIVQCQICGKQKRASVSILGELVRPSIVNQIVKEHPGWSPTGYICYTDLNHYRGQYVKEILEEEKGELSSMDREVIKSLSEHDLLSKDTTKEYEKHLTFGQKLADRVANFAGSWGFISFATTIIIIWILINVSAFIIRPYDPYPFILLNLVLSCIAALQAPIIIMSQNRQAERDRMRAREDYKINLKAELEIRHLSDKIDHILTKQWERMIDIQQIQMELMEEIAQRPLAEKSNKEH
ncbi:MAG: DUF1003 domain-containing protein [Candidatus Thermoplasmatota archaeon]|nr:DUF1003 domain-containing protein [Euryarchaeota archaeon]MBU4031190.1 DUF1003 domain-containing protein [Candidatus Thermoplasmatota archaeon]MBU4143558.1 DUF1003 domain-containing protein [Candidatus Thermoplasmatota archaeon]MBU4591262.1 DUF1003 domain-containing protein [Candidatus Thermoplasmatota archaeon]